MTKTKLHTSTMAKGKIVLFPLPLHGHMTPMLHLANALHSKGFAITIIHTRFGAPLTTNYPDFDFRVIEDGLEEDGFSDENLMGMFVQLWKNCLEPFRDRLSEIVGGDCSVACLISDPMWLFVGDVARSFNLHNLVLRTGSISASVVYDSLHLLREKDHYFEQETSLDTLLSELPPLRVKDLPMLRGGTMRRHLDFLVDYAETTRNSSGIIFNSFDGLEPAALSRLCKDLELPVFAIGPIHKYSLSNKSSIWKSDNSSISWLDTQQPSSVLYVCYGSTASISESDFLEIAWALAHSQQPFLWAVRPGLVRNSEWVEPLPNRFSELAKGRGHIVKWAPQQEVLAHWAVGGFITHCGWNSTLESVSQGVPLICLPCFADQMMNARYACEEWRVGIMVENGPRREDILTAIRRLTTDKEGGEIRRRVKCFKEKAHLAFKEGGSSVVALEKLTGYILSLDC